MKSLLILASLFISLSALAQTQEFSFITEDQQRKLLQALDNVCGDSWCEGAYNIQFKKITCDANACVLNMDLDSGITEESFERAPAPRYLEATAYLAKTKNFMNQLASEAFKHDLLTGEFYEEVNQAMTRALFGGAGKSIKTPQALLKPLSLKDNKSLTALLKNIAIELEGDTDVRVYFHNFKEVCKTTPHTLKCDFGYQIDRWNGEVRVKFKVENGSVTEIQSMNVSGNY